MFNVATDKEPYVPRYYQQEAEDSLFDYFDSGATGNPLIAMPTGTGKSSVIASAIKKIFFLWPEMRVMMLTHVKKLISQNGEELLHQWPEAPLGVYSAGLNSREMKLPIIFAGVQSVAKEIMRCMKHADDTPMLYKHFGFRHVIFIDEAHLLSPDEASMYQYIIAELRRINPNIRVIGLTATPYRTKQGMLTDAGGIFTDIIYDITGVEAFNRLIAEGFLCPVITKKTVAEIDLKGVRLVGGEFNQKQIGERADDVVYTACREMSYYGENRIAWMVFGSGVQNVEHIKEELTSLGVACTLAHSKCKASDQNIKDYINGQYQAIVSDNMLTTGVNHPPVDFIGDMQPTTSAGKHVQKIGRGTRPSQRTGKVNTLALDFAGNCRRLGPINDPVKPRPPGKGTGDAPVKLCPDCGLYNYASARYCGGEPHRTVEGCGHEFTFETKIFNTAGNEEFIRQDEAIIEYFNVQKVLYFAHQKEGSPPCMKVQYYCGQRVFSEWVFFESPSHQMRERARQWWKKRHSSDVPGFVYQALQQVSNLRPPQQIRVNVAPKYPTVESAEF